MVHFAPVLRNYKTLESKSFFFFLKSPRYPFYNSVCINGKVPTLKNHASHAGCFENGCHSDHFVDNVSFMYLLHSDLILQIISLSFLVTFFFLSSHNQKMLTVHMCLHTFYLSFMCVCLSFVMIFCFMCRFRFVELGLVFPCLDKFPDSRCITC